MHGSPEAYLCYHVHSEDRASILLTSHRQAQRDAERLSRGRFSSIGIVSIVWKYKASGPGASAAANGSRLLDGHKQSQTKAEVTSLIFTSVP